MHIEDTGAVIFAWRVSIGIRALLAIFTLAWLSLAVIWIDIGNTSRGWGLVAFGMVFALLGLLLIYITLVAFINKTTVRVGAGQIVIKNGPLPWYGEQRLRSASVAQLYVKETLTRTRRAVHKMYEIHATTHEGRDINLLRLETPEQAHSIEQEIERYLRIADQPVRGEYAR